MAKLGHNGIISGTFEFSDNTKKSGLLLRVARGADTCMLDAAGGHRTTVNSSGCLKALCVDWLHWPRSYQLATTLNGSLNSLAVLAGNAV